MTTFQASVIISALSFGYSNLELWHICFTPYFFSLNYFLVDIHKLQDKEFLQSMKMSVQKIMFI